VRRLTRGTVFVALLLVGLYGCFKATFPTYANRFRLTMAFNIDGQVYSGSSVIEVRWQDQQVFLPNMPYAPNVRGQAVFNDLGRRGAIVAALQASQGPNNGSVGVQELTLRAFDTAIPELPRLTGLRNLAPNNMPRLIWFSNVDDEKSARIFSIKDLPKMFGPTARLDAAFIEITSDPVIIDIDQKLPWYRALVERQKSGVISGPGFELSCEMFVEGSP
jgi:hypothetical protein